MASAPVVEKTFSDRTLEFADKAKLNKETITWFLAGHAEDYSDVAMGAETATEAVTNYAKPLISAGAIKADIPGDTIRIKKCWVLCRDQYESDRAPKTGTYADINAVIPLHEEITINAKWTERHNYELPDAQLLINTSLGKLWRECTANPPSISVWLKQTSSAITRPSEPAKRDKSGNSHWPCSARSAS